MSKHQSTEEHFDVDGEYSLETDAVAAHLDRGWDLVAQGKLAAARVSATHILNAHPQSPEGFTLLAAITAQEGEPEEALELVRQALDQDPEYLDAMLYGAELCVVSLGDFTYALTLCAEADRLTADPEDKLDIALLRAEAQLGAGNLAAAVRAIETLPEGPFAEPSAHLRAARVLLEAKEPSALDRAVKHLEIARTHEAATADAVYLLGVVADTQGRTEAALDAFLTVRDLDLREPKPSWSVDDDTLRKLVMDAMHHISAEFDASVSASHVHVREYPPLELISEGFDPRSPLFFGLPPSPPDHPPESALRSPRATPRGPSPVQLPEAGAERRMAGPAEAPFVLSVFVYRRNLERLCSGPDDLAERLEATILHELELTFAQNDEDPSDDEPT